MIAARKIERSTRFLIQGEEKMQFRNRLIAIAATVAFAVCIVAGPLHAQNSPLPLPPALEKQLADRATDVTEVTLGKNMLGFASKFMDGKDKDEAAAKQLIDGLDGIYVRSYEFEKDGQYSMDDVEQVRKTFETGEWTPMVRERERKSGETTDIFVKLVNGESQGMFILTAEPKELTIVLILGPIRMDDLGKLHGLAGLSALGNVQKTPHVKDKEKNKDTDKVVDQPKSDSKPGEDQ
jgi:hypothetical protein